MRSVYEPMRTGVPHETPLASCGWPLARLAVLGASSGQRQLRARGKLRRDEVAGGSAVDEDDSRAGADEPSELDERAAGWCRAGDLDDRSTGDGDGVLPLPRPTVRGCTSRRGVSGCPTTAAASEATDDSRRGVWSQPWRTDLGGRGHGQNRGGCFRARAARSDSMW